MNAEQIAFLMIKELSGLKWAYESTFSDCFESIVKSRGIKVDTEIKNKAINLTRNILETR